MSKYYIYHTVSHKELGNKQYKYAHVERMLLALMMCSPEQCFLPEIIPFGQFPDGYFWGIWCWFVCDLHLFEREGESPKTISSTC